MQREPLCLHLVQRWIKGPRTDLVAVPSQLLCHPRPVHLAMDTVVQDLHSYCSSEELSHRVILRDI